MPQQKIKTRTDFQRLARIHLREARVLAKSGNQHGAFYLSGLAVECALKACIGKQTKRNAFPAPVAYARDVYTHNLPDLLKLADLKGAFDLDSRTDTRLALDWGVVQAWSVESRYETSGLNGADLVRSVGGVLKWIRQHW